MCAYFNIKNWRKFPHSWTWVFRRINAFGVVVLLVLPQIYSNILTEGIAGNVHDYQNLYHTNSDNLSINQDRNGNMIRIFRFHNFEPRSLNEHTWSVTERDDAKQLNSRKIDSKKSVRREQKTTSGKRKVRGIHFEADGKDLSVNLEFIVPFLRVPVTRSVELTQTAFRKLADLNVNALLFGGGFVIAAALVVALVKTMSAPTFYDYGYKKSTRAENFVNDIDFMSASPLVHDENRKATKPVTLEQRLYANNINVTACAQRGICNYFQRTTKFVQTGKGTPAERIIDGLTNFNVLKVFLNDTALMHAIESGRNKDASSCEDIYRSCNWTSLQNKALQITLDYFMGNFATVNINTASLITTGLMAGGSLILAQFIRSLSPFVERPLKKDEEVDEGEMSSKDIANSIFDDDGREAKDMKTHLEFEDGLLYDVKNILNHFKLVYRNGTGKKVETTLPNVIAHIEDTFLGNQIDIGSCVQKYVCLMLHESSKRVRQGEATSIHKIIDGFSNFPWIHDALEGYQELKRAVKASKMETNTNCILAYPTCKWDAPETQLAELMRTHLNFI
ncbi:uncharacterized protein [Eurosta solidaginis]|uniref:uncharacterized protein n=1 Tax=Eurosta solidaginis TaxID=178769 RepID=UPI003530C82D